jgi:uncharacterized protein YciI
MTDYHLVELAKGPEWDHSRGRREQDGWEAHAAFMDGLVEEGVIVLGGPIGEVEGNLTLHVVDLQNEDDVRARFAQDPWAGAMLVIHRVQPWTVWLRP